MIAAPSCRVIRGDFDITVSPSLSDSAISA